MAYIYQITNQINGKIYIGKTNFTIEKRFKEHCQASKSEISKHRPLYLAMNKYGIENFTIEILEEVEDSQSSERERYWIEQKRSYKNGYNATTGGDGQPYLNYDVLIASYKEMQNTKLVAQKFNCSPQHLRKILKDNNIDIVSSSEVNIKLFGQLINQFDNNHNYIHTYSSAREAARALRPDTKNLGGVASHILDVCKGKRNSAYGYKWEYAN